MKILTTVVYKYFVTCRFYHFVEINFLRSVFFFILHFFMIFHSLCQKKPFCITSFSIQGSIHFFGLVIQNRYVNIQKIIFWVDHFWLDIKKNCLVFFFYFDTWNKISKIFFFIFDFYVLEEKKSYVAVNLRIALNLVKALIFE